MHTPDVFAPFLVRLERLAIPYFVTGSTAGILYGEPRMTHDVDIVVALKPSDVSRFVAAFPLDEFYCPPSRARPSRFPSSNAAASSNSVCATVST